MKLWLYLVLSARFRLYRKPSSSSTSAKLDTALLSLHHARTFSATLVYPSALSYCRSRTSAFSQPLDYHIYIHTYIHLTAPLPLSSYMPL